jgi:hypothetical protein
VSLDHSQPAPVQSLSSVQNQKQVSSALTAFAQLSDAMDSISLQTVAKTARIMRINAFRIVTMIARIMETMQKALFCSRGRESSA